jgi:hypothetical protein
LADALLADDLGGDLGDDGAVEIDVRKGEIVVNRAQQVVH